MEVSGQVDNSEGLTARQIYVIDPPRGHRRSGDPQGTAPWRFRIQTYLRIERNGEDPCQMRSPGAKSGETT